MSGQNCRCTNRNSPCGIAWIELRYSTGRAGKLDGFHFTLWNSKAFISQGKQTVAPVPSGGKKAAVPRQAAV